MTVAARIVQIGNSQGVRIPKPLLEESGLSGDVELEVRGGEILIRAARRARGGWNAAFAAMAARGDDAPVEGEWSAPSAWDEKDWRWEP